MCRYHSPIRRNQSGATLITGLIALLVLTVVGVAGMQVSTLEERMAANARRRDMAFHAAESALRAGETWLATNAAPDRTLFAAPVKGICTPSQGLYQGNCALDGTQLWETIENSGGWSDSTQARSVKSWPESMTPPAYYVEEVQRGGTLNQNLELPRDSPDAVVYRITGRGVGPGSNPDALAIVQSTFKKPESN